MSKQLIGFEPAKKKSAQPLQNIYLTNVFMITFYARSLNEYKYTQLEECTEKYLLY